MAVRSLSLYTVDCCQQLDGLNPTVNGLPESEVQAPVAADFGRRSQDGHCLDCWIQSVPACHPVFVGDHRGEYFAVVQQSQPGLQHRAVAAFAVDLRDPKQQRWFVIERDTRHFMPPQQAVQDLADYQTSPLLTS